MSSPEYEALTELIMYVNNQYRELGLSDSGPHGSASFWKEINSAETWKAPLADTLATGAKTEITKTEQTFYSFLLSLENERKKFGE